jgi:hypothetical protein
VGRASNRKKAQRRAGQSSLADVEKQQAMHLLVSGLQALVQDGKERKEREAAARRIWCGSADPVPAKAPQWHENSLGDRFFGGFHLEQTRNAPCLATAQIPDAAVIAADSAHWNVAASALVRAVVFDGLSLDHPTVSALVDAVWAAVGEDPLSDVLGVLVPALDAAVSGLDGQVAADALIGAFSTEYRCDQPGDNEVLGRIERYTGDALENLVTAGAVPPEDILPVGLRLLSALAQLCRSDSASLLQRAA